MSTAMPKQSDHNTKYDTTNNALGNGVQLKRFEKVVQNLLNSVEPKYVCLPPISNTPPCHIDWPFHPDILPASARVWGDRPGQLNKKHRAIRKEAQIRSLLRCILQLVPSTNHTQCTIVDFGGGSGHLALPLALLLPKTTVCVVDLNKRSLELMHDKANHVVQEVLQNPEYRTKFVHEAGESFTNDGMDSKMNCCGRDGVLTNLFSWHGPVNSFEHSFDIGIALHLCGEATDVALRRAASIHAMGIVVAPCCVGKLSTRVLNPDVYHATGSNEATIAYPQSKLFCQLIQTQDDWDKLARAADYSNEQEFCSHQNAPRRTAKALLETDRRLFLQEAQHYQTALLKMDPLEATPKNDILVAWKPNVIQMDDSLFCEPDTACSREIAQTRAQLAQGSSGGNRTTTDGSSTPIGSSNWSQEEETEIATVMDQFLSQTKDTKEEFETFTFPTQMGPRKRKLIHYLATQMDLAHWSVGSKSVDKTVAIARKRRNQKTASSSNKRNREE